MKGFFNESELKKNSRSNFGCIGCVLSKKCKTPHMKVQGDGHKRVMIVGEAPGEKEDLKGEQFVGRDGKYLRRHLSNIGIDLDKDCWKTYAVNCYPPGGRDPTTKEIQACQDKLISNIKTYNPDVIIPLGKVAIQSIIGRVWTKKLGGVTKWRGWTIPDKTWNAWICPTYHPSYLMKMQDEVLTRIFEDDLKRAFSKSGEEMPALDIENNIQILNTKSTKLAVLDSILDGMGIISYDYETTGIKPDNDEVHEVICVGIKVRGGDAYAMTLDDPEVIEKWKEILSNPDISKIAHNVKMEDRWSNIFYCPPEMQRACTMQDAHILDNRKGITSLKFQGYVNFGIVGYDDSVAPYLKGGNANKQNRIKEANLRDVLKYCAVDCILTDALESKQFDELQKLAKEQDEDIEMDALDASELMFRGALTMSNIEKNGIPIHEDYLEDKIRDINITIEFIDDQIKNCKEGKKWKKRFGIKTNFNSDDQLAEILIDSGFDLPKSKKQGYKTDIETLSSIDSEIVKNILDKRKWDTLKTRYLKNLQMETVNGFLHPSFNLHIPRTYRSSSDSPNFQNMPIRDPERGKIIRRVFKASDESRIVEMDYSGMEVRIMACLSQDPNLIQDIRDPNHDLHRDITTDIFILPQSEITKDIRFYGKNDFVFATFYGSEFEATSKGLWFDVVKSNIKSLSGNTVMDHLKKKGIRNLNQFTEHMKDVEEKFWKRYARHKEWRDEYYQKYLSNGYIDLITGFRCWGPLDQFKIFNYPVQGPAFHCFLKSVIMMDDWLMQSDRDSYLIGQIHDSAVSDVLDDELNEVILVFLDIMENKIREKWKWIVVPLEADIEMSPVGGTWFDKKEVDKETFQIK